MQPRPAVAATLSARHAPPNATSDRATPVATDFSHTQSDATRPAAIRDASPNIDYDQMLREACELADDGDLPAALRALRRVVVNAPPDTLAELERLTRARRGRELADFIADLRMRVALSGPGPTPLELPFATRYESDALSRRLAELHDRLLGREYHGRTLRIWSEKHEEYTELHADAPAMVSSARLAAAAIGARLRFDLRLKTDRYQRRELARLRADLGRLGVRIAALPGFTALGHESDQDDPTLRAARRLADKEAARNTTATQPAKE